MSHNLTIGFYDKDPFNFIAKDFVKEMNNKYGYWCPGYEDRIYTKSTHAHETRYALRVYPDDFETKDRDLFLQNKSIRFYCEDPKTDKDYQFNGFWAAENFFAETSQLLDYNITNVYQFQNGMINGSYFSYAFIDFESIYQEFIENLWDVASEFIEEQQLEKLIEKIEYDLDEFQKFIKTLKFLKPNIDIFSFDEDIRDCNIIDAVIMPTIKEEFNNFVSGNKYTYLSDYFRNNLSSSDCLYFVFDTGHFKQNQKDGLFKRLISQNNELKVVHQNYKNNDQKDIATYSYSANKMPYPLKKDLSLNF